MQKLKFGIVGCGRIAQRHAEQIRKLSELKAVCDIVESKAEALANKAGATAYTDIDKMLSDEKNLDVISVCTPNGLHSEHTIIALRKGFHVLCEKPMATSVNECGEMIKEAERANKRLFIVKQNRYNPTVQAVKNVLEKNIMGKIFNIH